MRRVQRNWEYLAFLGKEFLLLPNGSSPTILVEAEVEWRSGDNRSHDGMTPAVLTQAAHQQAVIHKRGERESGMRHLNLSLTWSRTHESYRSLA